MASTQEPGADATPKQIAEYVIAADHSRVALQELPETQRAAFKKYMLPQERGIAELSIQAADDTARNSVAHGTSPGSIMAPYAKGCWYGSATGYDHNWYGNRIHRFTMTWKWCANGRSVTSSEYRSGTGEALILGWRYNGVIQHDAAVVSNTGQAFAQYSFTLDVAGWTVDASYPCLRGFGDFIGNSTSDSLCGLG